MAYSYLQKEASPKILKEAMKLIGTKEVPGSKHNQVILDWSETLGLSKVYTADEIAWCGLFVAYVCHKAGIETNLTPREALWALNWNKFGTRQKTAMLGDVLTFSRNGGGHVGIYVGEDATCYHVLGGNQSNMVNIIRIEKTRVSQIRRTAWKVSQPANVRVVQLEPNGAISQNEA